MFKKIKEGYKKNWLLRVASFNSLSVFFKLITGFVVSKVMAIFIGPAGLAITGNLSNFMQSVESLSSLGVKHGVIKYVAEYREDELQLKRIISSAFFVSLCISIMLFFGIFLFSNTISQIVFNSKDFSFLFKVSAIMIPFYSIHIFYISILNGLKRIKQLIQVNIVGYIFTTILIVVLIVYNKLEGALYAIVISPFLLFSSLLYRFKMLKEISKSIKFTLISKVFFKKITSFFSMTLFSGIMFPVIFLLIRNHIIDTVGITDAGYWEATRKISNYYMLFVYTLFNMYLLPVLSEDINNTKFKTTIINFYQNILPIVLLGFIMIYFFRYFIIRVVFTSDFLSMQELFGWQLIGDFFRIVSLTVSYQFFAKKMILKYLICETSLMLFVYLLSIYLINHLNVIGAVKAHAYSYMFYTLLMFFIFRNELFKRDAIKQ